MSAIGWHGHRGDAPLPPTPYYLQQAGGKAAHRMKNAEDLVLLLIGCRTRESEQCISPGEHGRADPESWGTDERALQVRVWKSRLPPLFFHEVLWTWG